MKTIWWGWDLSAWSFGYCSAFVSRRLEIYVGWYGRIHFLGFGPLEFRWRTEQ